MNAEVSHLSVEYVEFAAEALHDDVVINPTNFPVSVALTLQGGAEPAGGDFLTALWGVTAGKQVIRFLFGSGVLVKPVGYYIVWVKILAGSEIVQGPVGVLEVK